MFCRNKFRAKLCEAGLTPRDLASLLGINEATLYRKMSGSSDFLRSEIQIIQYRLNLTNDDIMDIFFAKELA